MWRKIAITIAALTFAFGILFVSVLRTAAVRYDFGSNINAQVPTSAVLGDSDVNINYSLAYPGRVLPDSPLWPVKALRDRIWLLITTNKARKSELMLLFSDKRVSSAKVLFEKEKYELGYSTLTKAEKYLEAASSLERENRQQGEDTTDFLIRLAWASLKHYQVMNQEILPLAPEDAKPGVIQVEDYAKNVYNSSRDALFEKGVTPPENPFNWN